MNELDLGRWDWLLLSVALATLASLVQWLLTQSTARAPTRVMVALKRIALSPWVTEPLRLIYAVGLPAALLFGQGALTTRGLGLKPLPLFSLDTDGSAWAGGQWADWARDLGWTALVVLITFVLIWLGDRAARQGASPGKRSWHDPGISLREAVYHQAHWAFYREPFVVLRGVAAGSWLGVIPVALEALLSPMLWEGMRGQDTEYARRVVLRGGIYVATTLVFLQTQNLWIAIAADMVLGWLVLPIPLVETADAADTLTLTPA
jgi:hypothetical protein